MEAMIKSNELRNYDEKHPRPSDWKIEFIHGRIPNGCPYCSADDFTKAGENMDGIQDTVVVHMGRVSPS